MSEVMRQWLGETDASSRQIEFEEFRPMDRDPATGKSDFLSGPLSAASLGCTAKGLATDFLPGKPSGWESRILTPTLDRRHWKKSLRKDSATIRMVRFIPERLVGPPCHREKRPYLFSFPLIAGAFDSEKTRRNDTRPGETTMSRVPFSNSQDSRGFQELRSNFAAFETTWTCISFPSNEFILG